MYILGKKMLTEQGCIYLQVFQAFKNLLHFILIVLLLSCRCPSLSVLFVSSSLCRGLACVLCLFLMVLLCVHSLVAFSYYSHFFNEI